MAQPNPSLPQRLVLCAHLFTGEKLRKRLDDLEVLAASVAKNRQAAPAADCAEETALLPVDHISDETSPSDSGLVPSKNSSEATEGDWAAPWDTELVPSKLPFISYPTPTKERRSQDLSSWDSRTHVDPSHLILNNKHAGDVDFDCSYTTLADCGCPVRHVELRLRRSGSLIETLQLISFGEPTPRAPDPYMNHLRVEMTCNVSAMWVNSLHLGLNEEMLCEDESMSPFYRPAAAAASSGGVLALANGGSGIGDGAHDNNGVIRTIQSTFKTLKPDLRPTREQILIPHHPCLDAFPFPTLRRNILVGLDATLDEEAFFEDLIEGLICWAGAGLSRRDRNASTGRASTGTPWDSRSWEAKPWFLRKYWALLGGEDGELVRQSEWWRSMRGEDEDIWSSVDLLDR